jgi:hypothetical protein
MPAAFQIRCSQFSRAHRVPQRLQPLQHRLLDHAVDHDITIQERTAICSGRLAAEAGSKLVLLETSFLGRGSILFGRETLLSPEGEFCSPKMIWLEYVCKGDPFLSIVE